MKLLLLARRLMFAEKPLAFRANLGTRLAYRGWWRKHHGPFGIN
jgi:hypothetical protein